ncbi:MAG TPA: hypothetical protein DCP02_00305 [Actinobacteria bacterium]|nr:hypothetical protein [Actinomycetota bacterium]
MIAIQISLYPLEQQDIKKSLDVFWNILKENNVNHRITPLSTITWDDDEERLYNIIFKAYREARKAGPAVMISTVTTGDKDRIDELLGFL